jgi:two-component system chemotaxis response regulator CheB
MVVDDSVVIRGFLSRILESDPNIEVVVSVNDGEQALKFQQRHDIEVVVLDIEMPVIDGLTALPKLIAADPRVQVIMASTLTRRNAEISLKALSAGAADYVPKPSSGSEINSGVDFQRELVGKVLALGAARRAAIGVAPARAAMSGPTPAAQPVPETTADIDLRPIPTRAPEVLAVGSSTGGPQALFDFFGGLGKIDQPVFVTQHMPATFTTILAEHIDNISEMPCVEAEDGQPVMGGHIYVARGDFHMTVKVQDGARVIALNQDPPENYCRPSVNPMLRSLTQVYGARVLTVILTGMGQDGLLGGESVVDTGGAVIAQDEASSVVWGMPGAVAVAGICSAVLPLPEIAPLAGKFARGALK